MPSNLEASPSALWMTTRRLFRRWLYLVPVRACLPSASLTARVCAWSRWQQKWSGTQQRASSIAMETICRDGCRQDNGHYINAILATLNPFASHNMKRGIAVSLLALLGVANVNAQQIVIAVDGSPMITVPIASPTLQVNLAKATGTCSATPSAAPPAQYQNNFLPSQAYVAKGPVQDYSDLLGYSMLFYEAQRSGVLPSSNRVPWRNSSGLQDGFDNCIDLTGGYYDAGDYLKFTFPMSSSLSFIAWGGIEYWQGYVQAGQLGYLEDMMRWGYDWLIKTHPSPNTLYVQVGDGNVDNNYWGGDLTIPTPRPSYAITSSKPGTDVAAGTAASFAAGSILFEYRLGDSVYAQKLLQHAIDLYNFAETAPKQLYQNSVPAAKEWYASSDYGDELVWGALWLYRATGDPSYLTKADKYFAAYSQAGSTDPVDWDTKTGACYILGAELTAPGLYKTTTDWKGQSTAYLDYMSTKQKKTPGGLLWFGDSSTDDSIVPASDTALLLTLYATLSGDASRASKYLAAAQTQVDYVLGKNPAKIPYMIGVSSRSPKNPQSAAASGGTDIGNIDGSPKVEAHVIYGAVPGGPSSTDTYQDKRSNWQQSEVALDYNAAWSGVLAFQVLTGQQPFYASNNLL